MIKLVKSTFYNEADTSTKLCKFIKGARQLSFGYECEKFEIRFAKYQGRKSCIFVNSGSSANLALIQSLLNLNKIKKGDYVGFSALTWSTNAMPLIQLGLNAVPIDVEINTLNVSSRTLIETLKKHDIKMLFITNLLGFCDDIDKIKSICDKNKIILIEDNCESLGTVYKGKKLGNFGYASTFSFYVGHHMSTIEGGAICTDNSELSVMLRLVRAHGWDRNLSLNKQSSIRAKFKVNSTFYSRYTFYDLGYNLRPTEISGYIGNNQLQYLDKIIKKRGKNYATISKVIYSDTTRYFAIRSDHIDLVSNFAIPVICKSQKIRDDLVKRCEGKIEIRPIVGGDITCQPFYRKYMKDLIPGISNARLIHNQGFYFGNNPELTKKDVQKILKIFSS